MPELPEVETIVNELQKTLVGKKITSIGVYRENILQNPVADFKKKILQKKIMAISRYGKYIFFQFQKNCFFAAHLRMTGKFIFPANKKSPHHRVIFVLDKNQNLAFHDIRCFGSIEILEKKTDFITYKKLGIDALDKKLNDSFFFSMLINKKKNLKNFLIDQSLITGIGNIYACEILFKTKLSPFCKSNSLNKKKAKLLLENIQNILKTAIHYNGTSISNYRRVDNKTGEFQNFLQVYGKEKKPCPNCGQKIMRKKNTGQSTYYCKNCQK